MTKTLLHALLIGLLSVWTVACGDAGEPIENAPQFGEEVDEAHDDGDDQDEVIDDGNGEEDNGEEGDVEEEDLEPFCGDGFVDENEACDDGNDADGDGCSAECEVEPFEGSAEGVVEIDLIVDDLDSNEAPLQQTCSGEIAVQITNGAVLGDGRCFLPANFMDYSLDATLDDAGSVEGEITVLLNGRPNVLQVGGSFADGVLSLTFDGVTILVGSIRGLWDGVIEADFN